MPPCPIKSRISNCGNAAWIVSKFGGVRSFGGKSAPPVLMATNCIKQCGHSPPGASAEMMELHFGQCFSEDFSFIGGTKIQTLNREQHYERPSSRNNEDSRPVGYQFSWKNPRPVHPASVSLRCSRLLGHSAIFEAILRPFMVEASRGQFSWYDGVSSSRRTRPMDPIERRRTHNGGKR